MLLMYANILKILPSTDVFCLCSQPDNRHNCKCRRVPPVLTSNAVYLMHWPWDWSLSIINKPLLMLWTSGFRRESLYFHDSSSGQRETKCGLSFKRHFPTNLTNAVYSEIRGCCCCLLFVYSYELKGLVDPGPDWCSRHDSPSRCLSLWLDSSEVYHQGVLCLWRGLSHCVLDQLWQQLIDWMAVKRQ